MCGSAFSQWAVWCVLVGLLQGAYKDDGRGWSMWDDFTRKPGAVYNNQNGDVACDHYHRCDAARCTGFAFILFNTVWTCMRRRLFDS